MRRELAALAMAAGTAACEPCAGTLDCRQPPVLRLEGKVVDVVGGRAIPGTAVTVFASGDSAGTTTAADGMFSLSLPARAIGELDYDLSIRPPGDSMFHARGRECRVSHVRGSGCPLGLVVSRPYFPDVAEISYRGSNDKVIPSARVRFTRSDGASIYGATVQNGVVTAGTDGAGRVLLFGLGVYSTEVAEIIGRITVDLPPPLDSGWVDSVRLASALTFREPRPLLILRVGPSIDQTYEFKSGGGPARDVSVRITRVAGVSTESDTASAVTDSTGRVRLGLRPLSRGSITARLTVTPAAPGTPFSVENIVIETREDDRAPLYGTWDVSTGTAAPRRIRRDR